MSTIFELYYASLLADAAYVKFGDFGTIPLNGVLPVENARAALLASERFSPTQVEEILDRYDVVSYIDSQGFEATVFREKDLLPGEDPRGREPGRFWVGFRGTENAGDLADDAQLAILGSTNQDDTALNYFLGLLNDVLSNGSATINLTGHSLGGHLALNVALAYQNRIDQIYTVNTANVGGIYSNLPFNFGFKNLLVPIANRITNIQADPGIQFIGSFATGKRAGADSILWTEIGPAPIHALDQHYMWPANDAFDVVRVLAAGQANFSIQAINSIISAASLRRDVSLESTVAPLWRILRPNEAIPFALNVDMNRDIDVDGDGDEDDPNPQDDVFHSSAQTLFNQITSQLQGTYQIISMIGEGSALYALSLQDDDIGLAVRDALVNGDPYAVIGAGLHDSKYALSNFTNKYLQERSDFLSHLLAAQTMDANIPIVGNSYALISQKGYGYLANDILSSGEIRVVASDLGTAGAKFTGATPPTSQLWFGNDSANFIEGQESNDTVFGGAGNDTLSGGAGDDYLDGGSGNDILTGGIGHNVLQGGAGSDTYRYWTGDGVTIIDDSGIDDVISINSETTNYVLGTGEIRRMANSAEAYEDSRGNRFSLSTTTLSVKLTDGGRLTIDNFSSGDYGIGLPGTFQQPPLPPSGGQYSVNPNFPPFTDPNPQPTAEAQGGYANYSEWYSGSAWAMTWNGDEFSIPNYSVTTPNATIVHIDGIDHVMVQFYGGLGDSIIHGSDQPNFIHDDQTRLYTNMWNFGVRGHPIGNDYIYGQGGDDFIFTGAGDDHVFGGSGNDYIDAAIGGVESLDGVLAPNSNTVGYNRGDRSYFDVAGHTNADELFGEAGDDVILADAKSQTIDGGADNDYLFGGADGDIVSGGDGNDFIGGDIYQDIGTLASFVNPSQSNTLWWDDHFRSESVRFGDDILSGGNGDDTIVGGGGADVLDGGDGNDRLIGDFDRLSTDAWWSTLRFPTLGTMGKDPQSIGDRDVIKGGNGADEILGGAGDDTLDGGADNDYIAGGAGDDNIIGGSGADEIYGDYTNTDQGDDEIHGGDGDDIIGGVGGNDLIFGDAGDDNLTGGDGDDQIYGGDGNDGIFGGAGNDTLEGGAGLDAIHGEDGNDTLISGVDGATLYGEAGNDTFILRLGSGATGIIDTSGTTVLRFAEGVHAGDIHIQAATLTGTQSLRVYYSATDYAFLDATLFDRISRFEFADGTALTGRDLLAPYTPPTENIGDGRVHLNVDTSIIDLSADGSDLLLHYAGSASDWVNTADLTAKGVLWSEKPAADFGLGTGSVLILKNWYASERGASIAGLQGGSGEFLDLSLAAWNLPRMQTLTAASPIGIGNDGLDTVIGSVGADIILGGGGNDLLDPGAGNDIVGGEAGDDTYLIRPGNGVDLLTDSGGSDLLRFEDGLLSTNVAFQETSDGLAIVVGNPANNDKVVVLNWFDDPQSRIEQFRFSGDSIVLTAADVESRITGNRRPTAAPLADQTFVKNQPFSFAVPANAFVDPNGDALTYTARAGGSNVLPSWISFNAQTLTFNGTMPDSASTSVSIEIFATDPGGLSAHSAFSLTGVNVAITGTSGNDDGFSAPLLLGTTLNDRLEGLQGNDILRGLAGDDTLVGGLDSDILDGGPGNDTYLFNLGDGSDSIEDEGIVAGDVETLKFGSGILPSDLTFSSGHGGISSLQIQVGTGFDTVRQDNFFSPQGMSARLTRITFTDAPGTEITAAQIDAMVMVPSNSSDYLRGTNAADNIAGLNGSDTIYGVGGDDILSGNSGFDEIYGGDGNDTLDGGADDNTLVGGAGNDTYLVDRTARNTLIGATDSLAADLDTLRLGAGITSSNVRVERQGASNDLLLWIAPTDPYGTSARITLAGEASGAAGSSGVDEIRFADEPGTVWDAASIRARALLGTAADDNIFGYSSDDVLRGGVGNDSLNGGAGADTYQFGLGQGNDLVSDNSGANRVQLDAGVLPANVTLYRVSSQALLNTTMNSDALVLVLNGGTDQMWFQDFFAASGGTTLSEIAFANGTVWNSATLAANVTNIAGTANSVSGTAGNDSFTVDHRDDVITEGASQGTDTATSSVSYTLGSNLENLTLTGGLNLFGRGNALANAIVGNSGANLLYGLAGNDSLTGGAGNDLLDGGTGDDILIGGVGDDSYVVENTQTGPDWSSGGLQNIRDVVTEAAGEGIDTILANGVYSITMANNVENLVVSGISSYSFPSISASDDVRRKFIGNSLDNLIDARQAQSVGMGAGITFTGSGAGAEIMIDGGLGADTMIGGESLHTRFIVDNVGDVVVGRSVNDIVETSIAYTLGDSVENLALTGTSAISGTGNGFDNTLDGIRNTSANVLTGGAGNDIYILGAGDTAVELAGQGNDSVRLTSVVAGTNYTLASFQNIENISVAGTSAAVSLTGDAGVNVLTGNSGANTLTGGAGSDTLIGDSGNDTYDGFGLTTGNDVITDTSGTDTIRFNSSANTPVSQLDFTRAGNDLLMAVGAQSSARISNWYTSTNNQIETFQVYDQGLLFDYTGGEVQSSANGVNVGPRANGSNSAQAGIGQAFSYQLRANTFLDLDSQNALAYTAKLSDGSPLPSWLTFDSATRTFGGTAFGAPSTLSLTVTATDAGGLSATSSVSIDVQVLPITGTEGDDVLTGTNDFDDMRGLGGNDTLYGLGSGDDLQGGDGNDILDGGTGVDDMEGGLGNDIYYVDSADDWAGEAANEGTDEVRSTVSVDLAALGWADIENVTLLGGTALNATGNALANVLTGNSANNNLSGGSGNDTLDGGSDGSDTLNGGQGNDTFIVNRSGLTLQEAASQGLDTVQASITFTLATNFENLTLTGSSNIDGTGNSANNTITGNAGNNRLNGMNGTDSLLGGLGDDTYVVDSTGDTITEFAGEGTDTVESSVTFSINTPVLQNVIERLTLTNTSGTVTGTGNGLDNVLTGSAGNNTLVGGGGNDTLDAGTAGTTDALQGGTGDDTYLIGRTTGITITENLNEGIDTILTSVVLTSLASNVENLVLLNSVASGVGNGLNNTITGNAAVNSIDGGAGDDTLNGLGGSDTLTGGLGADTYQYTSGGGADTINNVSTDSLIDRLQFTDLTSSQFSFAHTGNNLVITRIGTPTDTITVTNWFSATANRIDFLNFTNAQFTAAQVDTAANGGGTLSLMARPVVDEISLSPAMQNFANYRSLIEDDSLSEEPQSRLAAMAGFGASGASSMFDPDVASTTLAGKALASESRGVLWRPIKSFLNDRAEVGVNRMVDAMAAFGVDLSGDAISSDSGALDGRDLQQLAVVDAARNQHLPWKECRTVLD